jgi:uncharacterized protein YqiB (DUF1249 family)
MGVNLLRERYRVDLAGLQATCEANYLRLMRLLPDMREAQSARRVALSEGEQMLGVLALEVLEACPIPPPCRSARSTACPGCRCRVWKCGCTTMRAWPR